MLSFYYLNETAFFTEGNPVSGMAKTIIALLFALLSFFCLQGQSFTDNIVVLELNEQIPPEAQKIGELKTGGLNQPPYDYNSVISAAKERALGMGGNIIRIKNIKPINDRSDCYKLTADVFKVENIRATYRSLFEKRDSISKIPDIDTQNYAELYIYAPNIANGYVFINSEHIKQRVNAYSKYIIKIHKQGYITIAGDKDKMNSVTVNLKYGKRYFLRCVVGSDAGTFRRNSFPLSISIADPEIGIAEFNNLD